MPLLASLESVGRFSHFGWRALLALPQAVRRPGLTLHQLSSILLGALPLGMAAGLAIGFVVWIHLRSSVKEIGGPGAVYLLPQALALAVVLEFAPLSAGLIVAGRSGASLGAELGSMRQTEQIDALEMLGVSPLSYLVTPRVLACMIALPFLTIFIDYLGVLSGYLAELVSGGSLSWTQYQTECLRAMSMKRTVLATLRTLAFGCLIGLTSCYHGMNADGGTEGVGQAATRSVVTSIFLVLAANVLLVKAIELVM